MGSRSSSIGRSYYDIATIVKTNRHPYVFIIKHTGKMQEWSLTRRSLPFSKSPKRLPEP